MEVIKELYDCLGDSYLSKMISGNSWTRFLDLQEKSIVNNFWQVLSASKIKKQKVLDLGMGPGRWSRFFLEQGYGFVVGLDISPTMVSFCNRSIKDRRFRAVMGNIEKLPFPDNSFDRIFCFRAFKYVGDPDQGMTEINRVLKRKGSIIVEFANETLITRLFVLLSSLVRIINNGRISANSYLGYFTITRFYNERDRGLLLKSHGFKINHQRVVSVLPAIPLPTLNGRVTKIWVLLDKIAMAILPQSVFARSVIVLAEKI